MFKNLTLGPAVFVKDMKTIKQVSEEIKREGFLVVKVVTDRTDPMFNIEGVYYEDTSAIIITLQYIKSYE